METANKRLREFMKSYDIPYWRVAAEIGVCEHTVLRWLRTELPEDKKTLIENAVNSLIAQQNK